MSYYLIIRGALGVGKSTISTQLAKQLHAHYIAIDRVLDEYDLGKDKEKGYTSQKSFKKANEIISPKTELYLKKGRPVVFDGNFYWKSQIDDLIQRLEFPHYVFTLKAPLKLCIERDAARTKKHGSDAARAVYKKSTQFTYGVEIDVGGTIDDTVQKIISYLPKSNFSKL